MIIYLEARSCFFVQMVVCLSLNFYFIVVPGMNIPHHKVVWCGCKCQGGDDQGQHETYTHTKRLRAEILELRKEQQAATEVPKWFRK